MHRLFLTLAVFLSIGNLGHAQGLHALRPLPGYVCMQLALSPEQAADPTKGVPVRDTPSSSVRIASWAPSIVVMPAPQQPTAGFLQVMFADKHRGWVQAAALKPWSSSYNPGQHCIPSVMSDGLIGFDFK